MQYAFTPCDIETFKEMLLRFHAKHADEFGPLECCTHQTCCGGKSSLEWLRSQLVLDQADQAA